MTEHDQKANSDYSGQSYDRRDPPLDEQRQVGHLVGGEGPDGPLPEDAQGRDIPPDNGVRAYVSPNGEVHGSGASDGGGNPGEDFDEGTPGSSSDRPLAGGAPDRGPE
jgi:hypothetical protein